MSLRIHLLGSPELVRNGGSAPAPRGSKSWALLAYLVLAPRPPSRRELAELLFSEADDPLRALRWSLSQLRRALAPEGTVDGDPVDLRLQDTRTDVEPVLRGDPVEPERAAEAGRELLDGVSVGGAPAFDSWLSIERRRLSGAAEAALHDGAANQLAAENHAAAVALARRAVELNPLEENHQELLVRCLATGGDREAAQAQVEACRALFERELGIEPSPAVQRAADSPRPYGRGAEGRPAAARGLLEAGRAAISAGATEAGVTSLREACAEAARCGDPALRAEAHCALGMALVHVVRGWDGEGAASLHQAILLAQRAGDGAVAATAHRELGWIGVVAGRREQAVRHLALAAELAEGDAAVAAVLGVQGIHLSDTAAYPEATMRLEESIERAEGASDERQVAYSAGMLARVHVLRGEVGPARVAADRGIEAAERERWLAMRPFPEAMRAEADRLAGDAGVAAERFERAFTLGCSLGDPCWEAFSARGLGMVAAAEGETARARDWFEEARTRCTRWPDRYQWAHAWVLDSAVALAVERGDEAAGAMAEDLEEISARAKLRELTARALLHRAALGEVGAATGARLIAGQIDNPRLDERIAELAAAPVG